MPAITSWDTRTDEMAGVTGHCPDHIGGEAMKTATSSSIDRAAVNIRIILLSHFRYGHNGRGVNVDPMRFIESNCQPVSTSLHFLHGNCKVDAARVVAEDGLP